MRTVQTSHVGSLPFTDLEQALDYTFQFDIPVLFTLPKKYPEQMMLADVVSQLGIGEVKDNRIILNSDFSKSINEFDPPFMDEFLAKAQSSSAMQLKYQLVGPYTFYKCLSSEDYTLSQLIEFLHLKYVKLIELLRRKADFFFVLDEPMLNLASDEEFKKITNFLAKLEAIIPNRLGIHCCAKLSLAKIGELKLSWLNLDISLYNKGELLKQEHINVLGLVSGKIGNEKNKDYLHSKMMIITPSCGLALSSNSEALEVISDLRNSKEIMLGAD